MYTRKDATLGPVPTLLAFVSGLVGTLSFVGLFGLFAAARSFLAGLPPATVMTGNLIQVIVDAVDVWSGHAPSTPSGRVSTGWCRC